MPIHVELALISKARNTITALSLMQAAESPPYFKEPLAYTHTCCDRPFRTLQLLPWMA